MLSTDTLGLIRTVAFGVSGLACTVYAIATLWAPQADRLPDWLPIAASIALAVTIFSALFVGGRHNAAAAMDEAYRADNTTAAALGFWGALVIGLGLWLTGAGGEMQLAITLTGASAIYMLAHVVFEVRGRGWL
jgi:hypothetical protein